jgi:RNA polymerase sigma factor (sigma-70 family)
VTFEEFYKLSFPKAYRYFYYKSVEKAYIEDLAHEVYIRFYQKYSSEATSLEECMKILYGICRNVYREWVRKQVSEKSVPLIDNLKYEIYDDQSYNHEVFEDDSFDKKVTLMKKEMKKAVAGLNGRLRLVLEYRFLQGKTRKEVAEILKINEKDVHTYQKRAIKYLKTRFKDIDWANLSP